MTSIVSLGWRALKVYYEEFKSKHPHLVPHVDEAEAHWREFLLGNKNTLSPYENRLFFLDYYVGDSTEIPPNFNWYTLRSVDATLMSDSEEVSVYVKLPWMVCISSIYPKTLEGWIGTAIKSKGAITIPQSQDADFKPFLAQRALLCLTSSPGPSKQQGMERLLKAMKNGRKFLGSETLATAKVEKDRQIKRKMKDMPETIVCLVDIVF